MEFIYADGTVIQSQCRHHEGTLNRVDESFQGTKGRAFLSANTNTGKLWDTKGNILFNHAGKGDPNPYQTEHDELFEAIDKGQYKFADAERVAKSTLTSLLGRYATYSGKEVKWEDALNSEINLMPEKLSWDALPKVLPDANGMYPFAIPGKSKVV